jgi:hypothetical protein
LYPECLPTFWFAELMLRFFPESLLYSSQGAESRSWSSDFRIDGFRELLRLGEGGIIFSVFLMISALADGSHLILIGTLRSKTSVLMMR